MSNNTKMKKGKLIDLDPETKKELTIKAAKKEMLLKAYIEFKLMEIAGTLKPSLNGPN